jgi:hypothetical protein
MPVTPVLALGWLPTSDAIAIASVCAVVGVPLLARPPRSPSLGYSGILLRELAMTLGLYSLWGIIGHLATTATTGAFDRGQRVWDLERTLHLPNEATLQAHLLGHEWLFRFLNAYYAFVHATSVVVFLAWLFFRHRAQYPLWRSTLAFLTLFCLLIQTVAVAPPRLVPGISMIDTAAKWGPNVYPAVGTGGPDQFSAMPSVHIAWAALFTLAVIVVSTSRWRWLMLGHLAATFAAVTLTANHYWLDGIVAMALIVPAHLAARGVELIARRVRRALSSRSNHDGTVGRDAHDRVGAGVHA